MLERNLLSHLRLAILLMLLASSVLLNAKLPSSSDPSGDTPSSHASTPLASIQVAAAITAIGSGIWEYRRGYQDMKDMKGFLLASKLVLHDNFVSRANFFQRSHLYVMTGVALVVFATCIVLIADQNV